jgi:nucleotide-binding universal stress UspA family protein
VNFRQMEREIQMLALKQILVPVDFSERSAAAARQAVALAERFDARLTFAHVIDRLPYEGTEREAFYGEHGEVISAKELDARFRRRLREFTATVGGATPPQEVLLKGDPAGQIAQFVQEREIDLVVVPTRGHGTFRKFLLGSVTAKILHDVNCPVLTGTHGEEPPPASPPYRRIGCAIDLSGQSEALLRWADEFAGAWGAKLVLIHATPPVQVIVDDVHVVTADWWDMVVRAAEGKLKDLASKLSRQAEVCAGTGDPVHFVTSTAAERELDLLIVGRGMAKQRASRLPTNAYGIIRESPCPVISLP